MYIKAQGVEVMGETFTPYLEGFLAHLDAFKLIQGHLNSFRLIQAHSSHFELTQAHLGSFKVISAHPSLAEILFRLKRIQTTHTSIKSGSSV